VARIVLSDTEVSSDEDDAPLLRRRLFCSDGSAVSGPPHLGHQALGVASIVPDGSSGIGSAWTAREVSIVVKATETSAVEVATAARVVEEATMKTTMDEAIPRSAANEATTDRATMNEAVVEMADQGAAGANAIAGSAGFGSSPAPTAGAKRAAASGGSTPPSKWFHGSWRPQYVE
jgi:hypothetical protein